MFKFIFSKTFLINIVIALLLAVGIILGIFKFIDGYTHHGETISVPSLEGLPVADVKTVLSEKGLRFAILDSIYVPKAEKGVVLDQNPRADDFVKLNRTIYITISKVIPPKITMPNVVDMSLRLAVAKLESYGLKVQTKYKPSECVNCVLSQELNNKKIDPKTPINKGVTILLIIGSGTSNTKVLAPYLIGLSQDEARQKLMKSSLNIGFSDYSNCETLEDSLNAKVFRQTPVRSQNIAINMGSDVDLYFTCDTSLIDINPPVIDSTLIDSIN